MSRRSTSEQSMSSVRNSNQPAQVDPNKSNELVAQISSKFLSLSQLMTSPSKIQETLMEQQWQLKIKDRLLKYPHLPGAKLFNKLSEQCWNEVYSQKEESERSLPCKDAQSRQILSQLSQITAEIREAQQKWKTSYSI